MPYIKPEKRAAFDSLIDALKKELVNQQLDDPEDNMEGNINYVITRLLKKCYGNNYAELNDAMGLLSCITHEFYRKIAAPYEDQKEFDNGQIEK